MNKTITHIAFAITLGLTPALAPIVALAAHHASEHAADAAEQSQAESVNINTADASALAKVLAGVGMSRAKAIVEYRETHGPFLTVEDLLEVRGVGKATLNRNRDRITLHHEPVAPE